MSLEIPILPEELVLPVRSLARAADIMRRALAEAAQSPTPIEVVCKHRDVLLLAEKIITRWVTHLGLHDELDDLPHDTAKRIRSIDPGRHFRRKGR